MVCDLFSTLSSDAVPFADSQQARHPRSTDSFRIQHGHSFVGNEARGSSRSLLAFASVQADEEDDEVAHAAQEAHLVVSGSSRNLLTTPRQGSAQVMERVSPLHTPPAKLLQKRVSSRQAVLSHQQSGGIGSPTLHGWESVQSSPLRSPPSPGPIVL